jgi:hypothetical protein
VLADCYNPQYSNWDGANGDSSWAHLMLAVRYNPCLGDAWTSVWAVALNRGDTTMADTALARMLDCHFLTRATIDLYHWTLRWLPQRAVIVVSGDFPTYGLYALQRTLHLRPDVAIVNRDMLHLPRYARWVRDHYGLPMPMSDAEMDTFTYEPAPAWLRNGVSPRTVVLLADKVIFHWLDRARAGTLGRPFTAQADVIGDVFVSARNRFIMMGPFYQLTRMKEGPELDTAAVRSSLAVVDPKDFAGPAASPGDPSPYRKGSANPACALGWVAAQYTQFMIDSRKSRDAEWGLQLVAALEVACGNDTGLAKWLATARQQTRSRPKRHR